MGQGRIQRRQEDGRRNPEQHHEETQRDRRDQFTGVHVRQLFPFRIKGSQEHLLDHDEEESRRNQYPRLVGTFLLDLLLPVKELPFLLHCCRGRERGQPPMQRARLLVNYTCQYAKLTDVF